MAALSALPALLVADPLPLVPLPAKMEATGQPFILTKATPIVYFGELKTEADLLASSLGARTGQSPTVINRRRTEGTFIFLTIDPNVPGGVQSYTFESSPQGIVI